LSLLIHLLLQLLELPTSVLVGLEVLKVQELLEVLEELVQETVLLVLELEVQEGLELQEVLPVMVLGVLVW